MSLQLSPRELARAAVWAGLLGFATSVGCSSPTDEQLESGAAADADEGEFTGTSGLSGSDGDSSPGADSHDGASASDSEDDPESETGAADSSTGGSSGEFDPAPEGSFPECPESWPDGWIFCEDFEALHDPAEVFFDYADGEGHFVPTFDGGASGLGAMRARYREGVEGAGFFSVSFGQNPINASNRPGYEPDDHFEEIYWRFRVKMQPGWPDRGPYNLTRVSAFAQSDWGQAMVASLASNRDDVVLLGSGSSCVEDNSVECAGVDDSAGLQSLGTLPGQTPLFSTGFSGQWHCIEAHVRLNTPAEADGVFEFWVDGNLENGRQDLDWRGGWSEFGLNLLSIENFWPGGAPADLERSFDDLVISTEPIGCD